MSINADATSHHQLAEIFKNSLQEIYWAETHLSNVMSSMSKASSAEELKENFEKQAEQTRDHAKKLEKVFSLMNSQPYPKHSIGLQGLFDEGWRLIDHSEEGAVRDIALLSAAQKVENYEIACYSSLVSIARTIGQQEAVDLLTPIYENVKNAGAEFSKLANPQAKTASVKKAATSVKKVPAKAKNSATMNNAGTIITNSPTAPLEDVKKKPAKAKKK